ncbi:hypothetical protein IT087_02025 [Candidatus Uhrbacteria bacterium]|nr:hypothetical protein [Candidatus Uhrbacteria bacterium]
MNAERSSPGTLEAPRPNAAEKGLRLARAERTEKEGEVLRATLMKRANHVLKDLDLPFELDEEDGALELEVEVDPPFSIKQYEGFDLEELKADPNFRTETRRIGSMEYVVTERIRDKHGVESDIVRPDGHGAYPDKEDLDAALQRNFFMAQRWFHEDRIFPEDVALIMHHHHPKPKEWLWRAMDALLASHPDLEPDLAATWAAKVIKGLTEAHRRRLESL